MWFCNMGPDLDSKAVLRTSMDISPNASKEPEKMGCAKNCEDISFLTEALPNESTPDQSDGPDVNVTDNMDCNEKGDSDSDSEDATEHSSSFGDTDSGGRSGPNDMEVESQLYDDASSSLAFDGFGNLIGTRKKKLTAHWRKFIRPLMWRCKWTELQIKELHAQALKYDRQLAECDKRKQHDLLNFTSEGLSVKATPITCQNQKVNIMKRKKRKRVEEETDVASYMSQHNLFSTLVNKKSYAGRSYMDDDLGNSGKHAKPSKSNFISDEFDIHGRWPSLEFKDDNMMEKILQKIDESQLQLRSLKVRMDKVISENATAIFSKVEASAPCNALTSSAPRSLPHENGDGPSASRCTTSQHTSRNREDVVMPGSAVSSHGEVASLDMVESTDQTQIGASCVKIKEEVLISDQFVKEEVGAQPIGKPKGRSIVEERNDVHPASDTEAVSQSKKAGSPAQQGAKMRPASKLGTPKNKRKRARRKSRFNKYSRRSSG